MPTQNRRNPLRRHPADREILRLAAPALGALVAEPLFLLTDSAFIGRLGTPQLAGLGIASMVLTTLVNVSVFLAYGTTAAVARMQGAGNHAGALRSGIDGCWLALIVGGASTAVGWPLAPWIVSLFGPAPDVAEHAVTYLQISLLGIPSMLLVLAATGVLRGLQDTRTPLYVATIGAISNIGLNYLLIYGAGLGVAGSALGTVIAQTGMAVVFIIIVARGAQRENVTLRPHVPGVRRAFGAGVPLIIRTVAMRVALLTITFIATWLGTAELAAHQVAFTTWTFTALVLDSVAIAAQALVGKALGAGNVEEARSITGRMVQWGVLAGVGIGVLMVAGGSVYASLFTSDPEGRAFLVTALIASAVIQPIAGWVCVLDGVLIGAGDGRYLAWASVISVVVFLPAAAAVVLLDLDGHAGIAGVWAAMGVWTVARVVTLAVRERGAGWMVTGAVR